MKNEIYIKIDSDINKSKDDFLKRHLIILKDKINDLTKLSNIAITNEDVLIVLSNYEDLMKEKLEQTYVAESQKEIKNIIEYIDNCFKTITYNGDIVKKGKLSNGSYYDELYEELALRDKSLSLRNKVAFAIKIIAIIIAVISILTGIAVINGDHLTWFSLIISGLLASLFLFGFGEIIQILHDIRKEYYKK